MLSWPRKKAISTHVLVVRGTVPVVTSNRPIRVCKNEVGGLVGVLNIDDFERLSRIKNGGRHCEWRSRTLQFVRDVLGALIHSDQVSLIFIRFRSLVLG